MAFLEQQDFEGAGTPASWAAGGTGSSVTNFDYNVAPLDGLQSAQLFGGGGVNSGGYAFYTLASAKSEIWGRALIRADALVTGGGTTNLLLLYDAGFSQLTSALVLANGSVTTDFVNSSGAGSIVVGTVYYLWWHYKAGPGGIWEIWWDTVNNRSSAAYYLTNSVSSTSSVAFVNNVVCTNADSEVWVIDDWDLADTDEFAGGGGALVGTAGITFGTTGNISATGALSAVSNALFAVSGGINATGALAASSAVTFDASGALGGGGGALVGTSAVTFGATGVSSATSNTSGTAAITFSATGTLSGPGALGATSAITFGATGHLTGPGALHATSAVVFTVNAVTTPGAMLGRCDIYFDAQGDMHGCYRYQGCVTSDFNYTPDGTTIPGAPYAGCNINDFGYNL